MSEGAAGSAMNDTDTVFATLRAKTAPQLLAEHARTRPEAIAFRTKHRGIYRQRTWRDYATRVAHCALGLRELGVKRGTRVAILNALPRRQGDRLDVGGFVFDPRASEADLQRLLQTPPKKKKK